VAGGQVVPAAAGLVAQGLPSLWLPGMRRACSPALQSVQPPARRPGLLDEGASSARSGLCELLRWHPGAAQQAAAGPRLTCSSRRRGPGRSRATRLPAQAWQVRRRPCTIRRCAAARAGTPSKGAALVGRAAPATCMHVASAMSASAPNLREPVPAHRPRPHPCERHRGAGLAVAATTVLELRARAAFARRCGLPKAALGEYWQLCGRVGLRASC